MTASSFAAYDAAPPRGMIPHGEGAAVRPVAASATARAARKLSIETFIVCCVLLVSSFYRVVVPVWAIAIGLVLLPEDWLPFCTSDGGSTAEL